MKNKVIIYSSIFTFLLFFPVLYELLFEWHLNWTNGAIISIICITGIIGLFFASLFKFKKSTVPLYFLGYIIIIFAIKYFFAFQIYYLSGILYFSQNQSKLNEIKNIITSDTTLKTVRDYTYGDTANSNNYNVVKNLLIETDMVTVRKEADAIVFTNDGFISFSEGILYSDLPIDKIRIDATKITYINKLADNWYCWRGR